MEPAIPAQDPQDKAFGASAARDQDLVDELDDWGAEGRDLPDEPDKAPRAGGKAEPEDSSAGADEAPNPGVVSTLAPDSRQ